MKQSTERHGRNRRRAGMAAAALLGFGLSACAELGAGGAPVMPPAPPPPSPERIAAAEALVGAAYRRACVETPIDLSGAEAQLVALGFEPLPPNKQFSRFGRGDVVVELRLGEERPLQASNCLVSTPVLGERSARAIGVESLRASRDDARLLTDQESRALSPEGGTFGLVEAAEFDGVANVFETIQGEAIVSVLSMIKTR